MKTIKNILALAALLVTLQVNAQIDTATTIKLINEHHFIFNATSAMPMASNEVNNILNKMQNGISSGVIQLSGSQYQLMVTRDSIEAWLPYYGRAYTTTMNPGDSGIKFKSKDFKYTASKKKNSWTISIIPKDAKDIQSMNLSISDNGYTTLNVNSNSRQPISFNGYITPDSKTEK